jgi:hypothetical protein
MAGWQTQEAFRPMQVESQQYTGGTSGFGSPQTGDFTNAFGGGQGGGIFGNMDLGKCLDFAGKGLGIFGDVMSFMNQKKMMEAGITGMNNNVKTGNYNMANNTNFHNTNQQNMNGNAPVMQNQFASMAG